MKILILEKVRYGDTIMHKFIQDIHKYIHVFINLSLLNEYMLIRNLFIIT